MVKDCTNCNHSQETESEYPCNVCVDDENGDPTKWDAAVRNDTVGGAVNHPQHYNHGKFECIDVMVENFGKEAVQNFCLLNAFKYVWRSGYKNGMEDIKKAMWYLDKWLELEGAEHE